MVPLVTALLEAGDPLGALELLDRYESGSGALYSRVASGLGSAGLDAMAARTWEHVLELAPGDATALARVVASNPLRAVEILRAGLQEGAGRPDLVRSLAEVLLKVGELGEAREIALEILRTSPTDLRALAVLTTADPLVAETRLRERLEDERLPATDARSMSGLLARMLAAQQREDEAADLLVARIDAGEEYSGLRWTLIELQPVRAFEYLSRTLPVDGTGTIVCDLWDSNGDALSEAGYEELATEAWVRALETGLPYVEDVLDKLYVLAPDRVMPALARRLREAPTSELWGALGDARWSAGRASEAIDAWTEAGSLNPEQEWWLEQVAAARAGRDPLE